MSAVDRIAVWTDQQCSTWFKGQRVHCETHDERWPCDAAKASAHAILAALPDLLREDSPDGEEAREALGLTWHWLYDPAATSRRLVSEWEAKP